MTARHDRYGDVVDDAETTTAHSPRCRDGWLGEDDGGRPVPCLTCRPDRRRRPATPWLPARPATASTRAAAMATIRAELARARRQHTGRQP